ncbi:MULTISPECIES: ATP-binding protein [unclassified Aminobacter]|uniref:AAA family ATPase n=1 Tax=unclassified Aminobacter TaxID=2644704 RepID=UPI001FEE8363|nr:MULTISPECIES: ATP-binding protein [unclassified Aminobacter]
MTTTVEALVAEERAKSHHVLADKLHRALASVPVTTSSELRRTGAPGRDFVVESEPRVGLDSLILTLPAERLTRQLVEEHHRADLLRAQGMQPRHRVLLSGPPGNGKTSLAEAVAEAIAVPLLTVRYDALVGAYLGETNARLARLFEYVRTTPCVLFFDEFDAVGKERGDIHETGEIKRVVSFLLMQLDQLPSYVVVVAATNHAELLDRAVWRRFQLRIDMPLPSRDAAAVLVDRFLDAWPEPTGLSATQIATQMGASSFADIFEFCQNIRRRHILSQGSETLKGILAEELRLWKTRIKPESDGHSPETAPAAPRRTRSDPKKDRGGSSPGA